MSYDIIGDVHGQYDKLVRLLQVLGYRETMRAWRHPERTAVFVGDYIDRGRQQVATVKLVRAMVDSGAAHAILGNHEFNAIAWATRDPDRPGHRLRSHTVPGNRRQHQAFLNEVEGTPLHREMVEWFKTLPLWLDLGAIRAVHACWHDDHMATLRPHLGAGLTLTRELIVYANRKDHWAFAAVEAICKGIEIALPPGVSFVDKDGKRRTKTRIRWWAERPASLREYAIASQKVIAQLPEVPVEAGPPVRSYAGPPVFLGHYWLTSRPAPLAPAVACVDYSAGENGPLVAYRWDGETELRESHFIWL